MGPWQRSVWNSLVSGSLASAATAAAAAALGKAQAGSAVAPLNAVSHILWGDAAGRQEGISGRHTLTGLALNHGAATFWAALYEHLVGPAPSARRALLGGAAVSALAYVTDYYLVPRRLTPGYELRLPPKGLLGVYGALALSLSASSLLRRAAVR